MKSLSIFVLGALLCFALCCPAGAQGLRVLTEETHPLNYSEDGKVTGFSTELLRAMLKQAGIVAEPEIMPWIRAIQLTREQPGTLLYSTARLQERENSFLWIGPISPINVYAYKLRARKDLRLSGIRDLALHPTGLVREMASTRMVLQQTGLSEDAFEMARNGKSNLHKLLLGRLEFAVFMEWNFIALCKELQVSPAEFEPVLLVDGSTGLYFAMNKNSDPGLVARLQAAWAVVQKSGLQEKLRKKYLQGQGQGQGQG